MLQNNSVYLDSDIFCDFNSFFKKSFSKYMNDVEKIRILLLFFIICITVSLFSFCIFIFFFFEKYNFMYILAFALMCIFATCLFFKQIIKFYKLKIKKRIFPKLLAFIGDFQSVKDFSMSEIQKLCLLDNIKNYKIYNYFQGVYKLLHVEIFELGFWGESNTFLFKISPKKKILGTTIIIPKSEINIDNFNLKNLEKINLDLLDFNKYYDVYSSDKLETRYLLNTAFVHEMVKLSKTETSLSKISVSFERENVFILVKAKQNCFDFSMFKKTDNLKNYRKIISELLQIFSIINSLNLEKKIGL